MRTQDMPVVCLTGTPRECGRIHGESLRSKVNDKAAIWKQHIAVAQQMDPDEYLAEFLETTTFVDAMRRFTPQIIDEAEGIAEGARLDRNTALGLQMMDEEWWYGRERVAGQLGDESRGCSTVGIENSVDGTTLVAQTMDIEVFNEGLQTLLRYENATSQPDALIYTVAGCAGLMGVNRAGIGVCVNALLQLNHSRAGLPVASVLRGLLARDDFHDAVQFLHDVPHASGQHYMVGAPGLLASVEASANQVCDLDIVDGALHTNHCFVNHDYVTTPEPNQAPGNSELRLNSLEKHLGSVDIKFGVDDVCSALSARDDPKNPVSRRTDDVGPNRFLNYTVGCAVFSLTEPPTARIAAGPPCSTDFVPFGF